MTPEHRANISRALTGKPSPMRGRKLGPSPLRGRPLSEETRRKISFANKGRPSLLRGTHISKRHKLNISKGQMGHSTSEATRKIIAAKTPFRTFGNGRHNPTKYERKFRRLHPTFEREKIFGTGKGGMSRWGCQAFYADFYDPSTKTVFEIDGPVHKKAAKVIERDTRKKLFLKTKGIKVVRIRNEDV